MLGLSQFHIFNIWEREKFLEAVALMFVRHTDYLLSFAFSDILRSFTYICLVLSFCTVTLLVRSLKVSFFF